jgi:hypothetical protein
MKARGKRPLGRPTCRSEEKIKMDLREIGWSGMDWINLAQDRGQWQGSFEHGNEPSGFIKCCEIEYLTDRWLLKKDSAPWGVI